MGSSPTLEAFANNAQRLSLVGSNPTPRTRIGGCFEFILSEEAYGFLE
jgi:hypothetical protein